MKAVQFLKETVVPKLENLVPAANAKASIQRQLLCERKTTVNIYRVCLTDVYENILHKCLTCQVDSQQLNTSICQILWDLTTTSPNCDHIKDTTRMDSHISNLGDDPVTRHTFIAKSDGPQIDQSQINVAFKIEDWLYEKSCGSWHDLKFQTV